MTATPVISFTSTPTATPTVVGAATPLPMGGPPDVIKLLPFPNPQSGPFISMAFNLAAPADSLELRVYTRAMTLAAICRRTGYFPSGWSNAQFEAPTLATNLYFVRLHTTGGADIGHPSGPVKLMWLP